MIEATYQFAFYTNKGKSFIVKKTNEMLKKGAVVYLNDHQMVVSYIKNKKIVQVDLKQDHSQIKEFSEFYLKSLQDFFKTKHFEELLTPLSPINFYKELYYAPIILEYSKKEVTIYPKLRLYDSGICVMDMNIQSEILVSSEEEICEFLNSIYNDKLPDAKVDSRLLEYFNPEYFTVGNKTRIIEGLEIRYESIDQEEPILLQELALTLAKAFITDKYQWIGRPNYAFGKSEIEKFTLSSLLNNIPYKRADRYVKFNYKNYRNFDDSYNHYTTIGHTITNGNIDESRILSLVIDKLFLYISISIYQLKDSLVKGKSIYEVLEIYRNVTIIQDYIDSGLKSYSKIESIMEDLIESNKIEKQITNLSKLIEIKLTRIENLNEDRNKKFQFFMALILALLGSETIINILLN